MLSLAHRRNFGPYHDQQLPTPGQVGSLSATLCGRQVKSSRHGWKQVDVYPQMRAQKVGSVAPMVKGKDWDRPAWKTQYGWKWQDVRAPDTLHEPIEDELAQYSWHNKVANVVHAADLRPSNRFVPRRSGEGFVPPSEDYVPRGGVIPRTTDVVGGDSGGVDALTPNVLDPKTSVVTSLQLAQNMAQSAGPQTVGGAPFTPAGRTTLSNQLNFQSAFGRSAPALGSNSSNRADTIDLTAQRKDLRASDVQLDANSQRAIQDAMASIRQASVALENSISQFLASKGVKSDESDPELTPTPGRRRSKGKGVPRIKEPTPPPPKPTQSDPALSILKDMNQTLKDLKRTTDSEAALRPVRQGFEQARRATKTAEERERAEALDRRLQDLYSGLRTIAGSALGGSRITGDRIDQLQTMLGNYMESNQQWMQALADISATHLAVDARNSAQQLHRLDGVQGRLDALLHAAHTGQVRQEEVNYMLAYALQQIGFGIQGNQQLMAEGFNNQMGVASILRSGEFELANYLVALQHQLQYAPAIDQRSLTINVQNLQMLQSAVQNGLRIMPASAEFPAVPDNGGRSTLAMTENPSVPRPDIDIVNRSRNPAGRGGGLVIQEGGMAPPVGRPAAPIQEPEEDQPFVIGGNQPAPFEAMQPEAAEQPFNLPTMPQPEPVPLQPMPTPPPPMAMPAPAPAPAPQPPTAATFTAPQCPPPPPPATPAPAGMPTTFTPAPPSNPPYQPPEAAPPEEGGGQGSSSSSGNNHYYVLYPYPNDSHLSLGQKTIGLDRRKGLVDQDRDFVLTYAKPAMWKAKGVHSIGAHNKNLFFAIRRAYNQPTDEAVRAELDRIRSRTISEGQAPPPPPAAAPRIPARATKETPEEARERRRIERLVANRQRQAEARRQRTAAGRGPLGGEAPPPDYMDVENPWRTF